MNPTIRAWHIRQFGAGLTFCAVLFSLTGTAHAQTRQLQITAETSIPFTMSSADGQSVYGRTADKVHELLRRSQIPYQIHVMSWNRAFELARTQSDTCVFETARTPDREASFKWVGPISRGQWGIYGRPEEVGKVTRLEQIKDKSIGGYLGDALGQYLDQHGYHVVNSYEDEIALKNLLIGRLDYWTTDTSQGAVLIAASHVKDKVALLFTYGASEYYLACNPQVSDEWIDTMKKKLLEIKADGTDARIEAKY